MMNLCKSWKHRRLNVNALLNFEKPHLKPWDLEDFEGVGCVEAVTRAGARSVFWLKGAVPEPEVERDAAILSLFRLPSLLQGWTHIVDGFCWSLSFFGLLCLGFFTRNAFFRWQSHTAEVEAEPHRPRDPPRQGVHLSQITNKGLWTKGERIKWLIVWWVSQFWATLFRHLVCWPTTLTPPRRKKGLAPPSCNC